MSFLCRFEGCHAAVPFTWALAFGGLSTGASLMFYQGYFPETTNTAIRKIVAGSERFIDSTRSWTLDSTQQTPILQHRVVFGLAFCGFDNI